MPRNRAESQSLMWTLVPISPCSWTLQRASGVSKQDTYTKTAKKGLSAKEKANKGPQRYVPNLGHVQQKPLPRSKRCQVIVKKKKKRKLARRRTPLLLIARRILWLQSRNCLWRIATICWIVPLSTSTRIFKSPKAIGLAAGNMYAQNVH